MKTKLSLTILLSLVFGILSSQVPQGFNYQAIARDGTGNILPNTPLQAMMYVQSLSTGGTIFWKELHSTITTNSFGLFTLVVGTGARQTASTVATFDLIDWSVTPKYLKTEIYYSGSWKDMGTSQLWSVPYALRTKDSDQWISSGMNIYRASGNVGIGTSTPLRNLDLITNNSNTQDMIVHIGEQSNEGGYLGSFTPSDLIMAGGTDFVSGSFIARDVSTSHIRLLNGYTYFANNSGLTVNNPFTPTVRMIVTPQGNVGIGTSTPQSTLHIRGNGTILNLEGVDHGYIQWYPQGFSAGRKAWLGFPYAGSTDMVLANEFTSGSGNIILSPGTNGKVAIGTSAPAAKLDIQGGNYDLTNSEGDLRIGNGTYRLKFGVAIGGTGAGDAGIMQYGQTGGYNVLSLGSQGTRLLYINGNTQMVGIGTDNPSAKLDIQPPASWDDTTPLFEVRNKIGVPVLAVYNNGVRILVDHTTNKAVKGGFAVGGYDMTKAGKTVDFMTISPDSIRFNINNDNVKALKGGFAVGGYDLTKKGPINQDFMYITPQVSNNGQYNTFLGFHAGLVNTANYNSFIGYQAGVANTTGQYNTFMGYNTGASNTSGQSNVYIGDGAGYSNSNGANNIYIGKSAGYNSGTYSCSLCYRYDPSLDIPVLGNWQWGSENTCLGTYAGLKNKGSYNVFIGNSTGYSNTNGAGNVFLGWGAGDLNAVGEYNTYIGTAAGYQATGNGNVFIGARAGYHETGSDLLYIDNRSTSTPLIWGDFAHSLLNFDANVGIGISPTHPIHVWGGAYCSGTTWVNSSDKNLKENFESVDGYKILSLIDALPIMKWKYKTDSPGIKHIGPVAQDFYALFGLGNDDKSISSVDPSGIALAAIKELSRQNKSMQHQLESTILENQHLKSELDDLRALVNSLIANQTVQVNN
jgi:hypothetical protein